MPKLTIHTATYNRDYILGQAYESLKKQTNKDFEWIITDDGSEDNTEEMVKNWIEEENEFSIIYNKLKHVGIPRALNYGINQANTEWFMMLDSDDYILPDTVEKVLQWLEQLDEKEDKIAGIGFAKCFPDGKYMKAQSPVIDSKKGYTDATHIERKLYKMDMDMCEVHKVQILKKYPFLVWENETYAPEQLSFNNMALDGWKLRWRADKLYVAEYLPGGQTRDDRIVKKNPMGFAMMHNQNLLIHKSAKDKMKDVVYMTALCYYARNLKYLKKSNNMFLTVLLFPIGILVGIRRVLQYKKLK